MLCPKCKGTTLRVYESCIQTVVYDCSDPSQEVIIDSEVEGGSEAEDMSQTSCDNCDWVGTFREACDADTRAVWLDSAAWADRMTKAEER